MAPAGGEGQRREGSLAGRQCILPQARAGSSSVGCISHPVLTKWPLTFWGSVVTEILVTPIDPFPNTEQTQDIYGQPEGKVSQKSIQGLQTQS